MSGLIKEEDLKVVKALAEKYGLSVNNFAKELLKNKERKQLIIRVTLDEVALLNKKSKRLGISRNKYGVLCFEKAVKDGAYKKINIIDVVALSKENRTERIAVSFSNREELMSVARKLGVDASSLLRYILLTTEL